MNLKTSNDRWLGGLVSHCNSPTASSSCDRKYSRRNSPLKVQWPLVAWVADKALTIHLFLGSFSPIISVPFFASLLFPLSRSGRSEIWGIGGALLALLSVEGSDIAATRHVLWALNAPKCICGMGVFRAQRTCLAAAGVVLFLINEIWKLKQMRGYFWMYCMLPCSRLLNSTWSFFTFYLWEGVLTSKTPSYSYDIRLSITRHEDEAP